MSIPPGMTYFDAQGNFNVIRADIIDGRTQLSQGKARPAIADLRVNSDKYLLGDTSARLLDKLEINAESPDKLFDLMRTCLCFQLADLPEDEVSRLCTSKSEFFRMTREQGVLTYLPEIQVKANGMTVALVSITAPFNPAALALLSLPAYFVMDLSTYATIETESLLIGRRGIYSCSAPPRTFREHEPVSIQSLSDYMDAFHFGNFLNNNSDAWLSVYGVSYCLAAFVQQLQHMRMWEKVDSIRGIIHYEPFAWVYDRLVQLGALHDPFDRTATFWRMHEDGIENASDVNGGLCSCLKLARLLQPVPLVTCAPGAVESIFYGLIDIFDLRRYFGIDPYVRFDYPK